MDVLKEQAAQARELAKNKRQALLRQPINTAGGAQKNPEDNISNLSTSEQTTVTRQQPQISRRSSNKISQALSRGKDTYQSIKKDLENKHDLGPIGSIIFIILMATAIQLDLTDVAGAGVLTYLGVGILKAMQTVGTFFGILIVTGEPLRALLGRRTAINIVIMFLEMFFGVNTLPLHSVGIIITVVDLKTNFLSLRKYLPAGSTKNAKELLEYFYKKN